MDSIVFLLLVAAEAVSGQQGKQQLGSGISSIGGIHADSTAALKTRQPQSMLISYFHSMAPSCYEKPLFSLTTRLCGVFGLLLLVLVLPAHHSDDSLHLVRRLRVLLLQHGIGQQGHRVRIVRGAPARIKVRKCYNPSDRSNPTISFFTGVDDNGL